MSGHTFCQISILVVKPGCIGRNTGYVSQIFADTPHVKFWWKSLDFYICAIQTLGTHGRVYLVAILVYDIAKFILSVSVRIVWVDLRLDSQLTYDKE